MGEDLQENVSENVITRSTLCAGFLKLALKIGENDCFLV